MRAISREERLKELKAERHRINKEIKELEFKDVRVGGLALKKRHTGYTDILWLWADEKGDNHRPVIITGACKKELVQEIGRMIGDLTKLKEKLDECKG